MIFLNRLQSIFMAGFILVVNGWTQESLWEIPHPGNAVHPGSEAAPHSDPRTYPFETEFQERVDSLVADLAAYPVWNYRKGYYQDGNDPAKRVPAHAAARLMRDPNDPDALAIMNDDRAPTEHYHFAAVNWARYLPIFGSRITDETFTEYSQRAATYDAYTRPGGTENHKVMWFTSGLVLPHYIKGDRIGDMTIDAATDKLKTMLRNYVKGLFSAGQGEWDSSTYLVFDLNGMMNIYDFHPDPECRLMAKAALDWFVAGYALKYTDGIFCSPHKRGYADEPADTKTDESGWIWWGTESDWFPEDMGYHYATFHTFTSSYRPNKILCDIATGKMPDFEARNTKPDYWFGHGKSPSANQFQETVYKTPHYTMGTLWQGHYIVCKNSVMTVNNGNEGYVIDFRGELPVYSDFQSTDVNTSARPVANFHLYANYPNPFNSGTTIRFSIDEPARVNMTMYNIQGQIVRTLNRKISNGDHRIRWDGQLENGQPAPTGVYFIRLNIDGLIKQHKMLLLK
jgi:hypothetical protein